MTGQAISLPPLLWTGVGTTEKEKPNNVPACPLHVSERKYSKADSKTQICLCLQVGVGEKLPWSQYLAEQEGRRDAPAFLMSSRRAAFGMEGWFIQKSRAATCIWNYMSNYRDPCFLHWEGTSSSAWTGCPVRDQFNSSANPKWDSYCSKSLIQRAPLLFGFFLWHLSTLDLLPCAHCLKKFGTKGFWRAGQCTPGPTKEPKGLCLFMALHEMQLFCHPFATFLTETEWLFQTTLSHNTPALAS